MTNTEVVPYASEPLSERMEYARILSNASLIPKSLWSPNRNDPDTGKLIPGAPSAGNVLLVMEHGAMLGLHPMAAINGIFIIEGKASMSANLMSAVVRGQGYKLRVRTEGEWGPDFKAIATLVRPDDPDFEYRVEWTEAKAKKADLLSKDNWRHYPEGMAKARAISEVIREGATDALNGIGYTPEELGATVSENGEVIEGELVEETPAAPTATPPARKRATNGTQGTKRTKAPAAEPEPADEPAAPPEPITAEEVQAHLDADPNVIDAEIVEERTPEQIERDEKDAAAMSAPSTQPIDQQAALDRHAAEQEEARKRTVAANVAAAKEEGARKRAEREAAEEAELRAADAEAAMSAAQAAEEMAADTTTGEVPEETGEQVAARIKADRAARAAIPKAEAQAEVQAVEEPWGEPDSAEDVPSEYDRITAMEPENWEGRLLAATTVEQVKAVWDEASLKPGAMTTELRVSIIGHKKRVQV